MPTGFQFLRDSFDAPHLAWMLTSTLPGVPPPLPLSAIDLSLHGKFMTREHWASGRGRRG